jgi:hypothetical protein
MLNPISMDSLVCPAESTAVRNISLPLKLEKGSDASIFLNKNFVVVEKSDIQEEKPQEEEKDPNVIEHKVEKNECVWNIAKKYLEKAKGENPTNAEILEFTKEIMDLNGLKFDNKRNPQNYYVHIAVGQTLKIPVLSNDDEAQAKALDPLTQEEIQDAEVSGKLLADNLTNWWTTRDDQKSIKTTIEQRVNERNVLDVLKNYEAKKRFTGDSFFEQMRSEWDFEGKHALIKDVANKLRANLEASGNEELVKRIDNLNLDKDEITKEDAQVLDSIVKQCIK